MLNNSKKPLIAILCLLIASLACYSDSPLWVFGVTEVPPTTTFLPTPGTGPNEYPANLDRGDLALAPKPISASQAFFFVTNLPEELLTGVRNAAGSCDYNAQLRIHYVGNQFEEFRGNVYVDDITLATVVEGQEPTLESLFDFEADVANWDLNSDFPAGKGISQAANVDFARLAGVSQIEETVAALDGAIASAEGLSAEQADDLQAKLDAIDAVIASLQNGEITNSEGLSVSIATLEGIELSESTQTAITATSDLLNTGNASTEELDASVTALAEALTQDRNKLEAELVDVLANRLENLLDLIDGDDLLHDRGDVLANLEAVRTEYEETLDDPNNATADDLRDAFDDLVAALGDDREATIATGNAVDNDTAVLQLQADYKAEEWVVAGNVDFAEDGSTGLDWSTYSELSLRIFAPRGANNFKAHLFLTTAAGELEVAASNDGKLTSERWTQISFDLSALADDLSDVRAMELKIGPDPANRYYLVECSGTVGWTNGDRLAGPVRIVPGQSALTRSVGLRGETITQGAGANFDVSPPGSSPPDPSSGILFPDSGQRCLVDEVVDINKIFAYDNASGVSGHQLWYEIACASGTGWVTEDRLFGPLVLPERNGIGLISSEFVDGVELTANPGPVSDTNEVVGTCPADQFIQTIEFNAIAGEVEGTLIPFYHIQCGEDLSGWTEQSVLLEVPYLINAEAMVIGPEDVSGFNAEEAIREAEAEAAAAEGENAAESTDAESEGEDVEARINSLRAAFLGEDIELVELQDRLYTLLTEQGRYNGDAFDFLSAPLTLSPGPAFEENIVGSCPTGTIVTLNDVGSAEGRVYYQINCGDVEGWIDSIYVPNRAELNLDSTYWFVRPSTTGRGEAHDGYSLRFEPLPAGTEIPDYQCALYSPITINRVVIYQRALKSLGFSLFYEISCQGLDGVQISGFVEQRELVPDLLDRDPTTLIGG